MALLPAYWLVTLHAIAADSLAPAAMGVFIMGMVGAAAGYCWSNVAGLFDYSLPAVFHSPGTGRGNGSGSFSAQGLLDEDSMAPPQGVNLADLEDDEFFPSKKLDKQRFNFSYDWRDEYSSPASCDKDVFGKD